VRAAEHGALAVAPLLAGLSAGFVPAVRGGAAASAVWAAAGFVPAFEAARPAAAARLAAVLSAGAQAVAPRVGFVPSFLVFASEFVR